jgi:hypothetical protein
MNSFLSKHTSFGSVGRGYVSLSLDIIFYLLELQHYITQTTGQLLHSSVYLTKLVRIMDYKDGISD